MKIDRRSPTLRSARAAARDRDTSLAATQPGKGFADVANDASLDAPTTPALLRFASPPPRPPEKTPAFQTAPISRGRARATLTLMSGVDAGRVFAVEAAGVVVVIGRSPDATLRVDDPGVSRLHARLVRDPSGGFYVEDLGSTNGTFVGGERVRIAPVAVGDHVQLGPGVIFRFGMTCEADDTMMRNLHDASIHDPLTRTFNRRYLIERLEVETTHVRRESDGLAVILLDIDRFKTFNDRFGHFAGDRVLCVVAAELSGSLRESDMVARYGGEEFVVVARGIDIDGAARLADRLRLAVEALPFTAGGRRVRVTVSAGVASIAEIRESPTRARLLQLADERLYLAKEAGRNQVCARSERRDTDTPAPEVHEEVASGGPKRARLTASTQRSQARRS